MSERDARGRRTRCSTRWSAQFVAGIAEGRRAARLVRVREAIDAGAGRTPAEIANDFGLIDGVAARRRELLERLRERGRRRLSPTSTPRDRPVRGRLRAGLERSRSSTAAGTVVVGERPQSDAWTATPVARVGHRGRGARFARPRTTRIRSTRSCSASTRPGGSAAGERTSCSARSSARGSRAASRSSRRSRTSRRPAATTSARGRRRDRRERPRALTGSIGVFDAEARCIGGRARQARRSAYETLRARARTRTSR